MKIIIFFILIYSSIVHAQNLADIVSKNNNNIINSKKLFAEKFTCFPSSTKKIMQSFFFDDNENTIWLSFDNKEHDSQLLEEYDNSKKLISQMIFSNTDSIGHLDGLFVKNSVITTTNSYKSPSVILLHKNKIIKKYTYSQKIYGNQIIAMDRNSPLKVIVWASSESRKKVIYMGNLDVEENIIHLMPTKINFPQNEVMQGLALDAGSIYALTGSPNNTIKLYNWNGKGFRKKTVTEIDISKVIKGGEYRYEAEGINIIKSTGKLSLLIGLALIDKNDHYKNCIANISTQ